MTPISIRDLTVAYNGRPAVHQLSLDLAKGRWITLIGPNGAGKTSVLRAVAGLVDFGGEIVVEGDSVRTTARRKLARLVAYVPQRPFIPPTASVTDYVLMGRTPYIPYFGTERPSDLEVVGDVLDRKSVV